MLPVEELDLDNRVVHVGDEPRTRLVHDERAGHHVDRGLAHRGLGHAVGVDKPDVTRPDGGHRLGDPLPAERHDALYVFNHGVAVLDPEGKVAYLQIFGGPDEASIQRSIAQLYVKHFQKPGGKPKAGGSGGGPEKK